MDSQNPLHKSSGFMHLLNSQQENHIDIDPYEGFSPTIDIGSSDFLVFSSQQTDDPIQGEHTAEKRRERRTWSPKEDVVLISAWLNTSKDPVVGNEQRAASFWTRIAAYYNSSLAKIVEFAGTAPREAAHCKQRWQKINDQVCKFVGCYEAAKSQKKSGWNPNDVMKLALEIFYSDHKVKFTLEHAWLELRHDQKWCDSSATKGEGSSKRRKVEEGSTQSPSCQPIYPEEAEALGRPAGVKASKAKSKRPVEQGSKALLDFQNMWAIKEKDLAMKDKLSDKKLLDSLLGKTEPLSDIEMALKNKLISDMLSN